MSIASEFIEKSQYAAEAVMSYEQNCLAYSYGLISFQELVERLKAGHE